MKITRLTTAAALAVALPAFALQEPAATPAPPPKPAVLGLFVYPGTGQDASRQGQDENECYAWAGQQTKIDPMAPVKAADAPDAPKGGAVKGAARGAARGAAVGAIGDDRGADENNVSSGEGAAAGAVVGAAKGRRAQKKAGKQAEQKAQDAATQQATQAKETFKKAWGACLEGKGYSVK